MTCARCEYFSLKPIDITTDEIARAALRLDAGLGHCSGFLTALQIFVEWNGAKCRLYRAAKQMAPRDKWIFEQQLKISEKEKI